MVVKLKALLSLPPSPSLLQSWDHDSQHSEQTEYSTLVSGHFFHIARKKKS